MIGIEEIEMNLKYTGNSKTLSNKIINNIWMEQKIIITLVYVYSKEWAMKKDIGAVRIKINILDAKDRFMKIGNVSYLTKINLEK
ncbi:MAG: hypothetical protein ACOH2A_08940 [Sphingobacteriaceae bacterium]